MSFSKIIIIGAVALFSVITIASVVKKIRNRNEIVFNAKQNKIQEILIEENSEKKIKVIMMWVSNWISIGEIATPIRKGKDINPNEDPRILKTFSSFDFVKGERIINQNGIRIMATTTNAIEKSADDI